MKTPLEKKPPAFNLKFLLVGNSGSGKTHFCGTYTKGPVHFYMLDPGGEITLHKINKNRPSGCEISIDLFSPRSDPYSKFWKTLQQDEKDGFFDEMAERKGLIVLPDSLSTASEMAVKEIAKKNKRSLYDPGIKSERAMRIQDWGQVGVWIKELIGVAHDLPCASATLAHIDIIMDKDREVLGRYPMLTGKVRYNAGKDFDEVYLLESVGSKRKISFVEKGKFSAKSRAFSARSVSDITMDELATAYLNGDDLTGRK